MAKKTWIELGDVVVGDSVIIYRQLLNVTKVVNTKGSVTLTGNREDGGKTIYIGVADESVQKVEDV